MFAPLGFVSLDEIESRLHDVAEEWRLLTPHENDPEQRAIFDYESGSFIDLCEDRLIAYREWLFQCFLNRHERNLYVCTRNGQPLKLSDFLVRRCRLFEGPFEDDLKGWSAIVEHLKPGAFMLVNRDGYIIDIEHSRQRWGNEVASEVASVAGFLDKCPICWKLPDGKPIEDWRDVCGISKYSETLKMDGSPEGLKRRILEAWGADRTLTKEALKERLAPTLSFRQFRLGWQLAVLECPELSRPGRRGGQS